MSSTPQGVQLPPIDERFERLVRAYSRLIRAAVARVGGTRGQGHEEEIEQRVLVELWRQVANEQVIHNPSSYIYRAAVRETVRVLRREQSHAQKALVAATEAATAVGEASPERLLESKELGRAVETALTELRPERARAVRAHLAGFAVREIMGMYRWPYQKTRNLISRGMGDLRRALRRTGIHDAPR